ncbi:unnamed protein product [Gemmata massiliana]|uniref:Uncharacterized protein n=1 Tax=Gemmata massiliana TaxID=1210884 RepID=A0A6P2CYD9_9BACT|nr:hypothetical protein [Gemmata massiliana]VTR93567.1 unnamed protein product [Gemmata massiliana]
MDPGEILTSGGHMVSEARAIRAAFPDVAAMTALPVSALPPKASGDSEARKALGYLRDEMLLVRAGTATDLTVLDDEIANVERLWPPR